MSNPLNITLFPPDTICFNARQLFLEDDLNCTASNFTITQSMLMFLNLTADEKRYRQAYCIAPPSDDTCAFGYCPNGDIAGMYQYDIDMKLFSHWFATRPFG